MISNVFSSNPTNYDHSTFGKRKRKELKNCRITEANGAEITSPHILDMTDCNFESKVPP